MNHDYLFLISNASNMNTAPNRSSSPRFPGISSLSGENGISALQPNEPGNSERETKRYRAKLPKVRTGCFRCRARHVKCDEAKPSCERCRKFGIECDGYGTKPKSYKPDIKKRTIAPKTHFTLLSPMMIQSGPRIQEDEARYFRFFCEETAAEITGPYKTSIWARLVPQAGETEPFIAYATVALGALAKSIIDCQNNRGAVQLSLSNPHFKFALKIYCKALKGMREAIEQSVVNPRNALIACLLAFCFESVQGNEAAASTHAYGSVHLLYDCHNRNQHLQNMISMGKPLPASYCASHFSIEEDLHAAYFLLDCQAYDRWPIATHQRLVLEMNQAITYLPRELTNLKPCCTFIQLIVRRNLHWMVVVRAAIQEDASTQCYENREPNTMYNLPDTSSCDILHGMHPGNSTWNGFRHRNDNIPLHLLVERQQYLEDLQKWNKSSKRLYEAVGYQSKKWSTARFEEFVHINMLRIWALNSVVLLASTFYPPETAYDIYLPEFRTMTELSEILYPHLVKERGPKYHFIVGIVPALFQVGMMCRDRYVRGRAIEMLCRTPGYREGIWDAMAVGKIAECAMNLEEEGRDENGHIPGDQRVHLVTVKVASKENRATAVFRQGVGPVGNGIEDRRVELSW